MILLPLVDGGPDGSCCWNVKAGGTDAEENTATLEVNAELVKGMTCEGAKLAGTWDML